MHMKETCNVLLVNNNILIFITTVYKVQNVIRDNILRKSPEFCENSLRYLNFLKQLKKDKNKSIYCTNIHHLIKIITTCWRRKCYYCFMKS